MTDEAFTQGILAMRQTLYRVSYGLLRNEQDRRDAVQEAITKAWEKRQTLRDDQYLKTWVIRILINECHTQLRRQKRTHPMDALAESPAPPDADPALHDAVLALQEQFRLPIMLHYMEGYSLQEIADMLRIPLGTVGTRLHRGRLQLRGALGEEEGGDAHG